MTELKLDGPGQSYVRVIADSVSIHTDDRVTSFEVNGWRFTLAEMNTHCVFARNSASSRAIPIEKAWEAYRYHPALPAVWAAEHKGMSGGAELEGQDLLDAQNLFHSIRGGTADTIDTYLRAHPDKKTRLHKSLISRLMEPMQFHKALITASSYGNFFDQRCHPDAQPELRVVAELMKELYAKSQPKALGRGSWHLPYIRDDEKIDGHLLSAEPELLSDRVIFDAREISSARCGRTSYMSQEGIRDYADDQAMYGRLVGAHHWSPLEHVCTPWRSNVSQVPIMDPDTNRTLGHRRVSRLGKFVGWAQWRHIVEAKEDYVSQR